MAQPTALITDNDVGVSSLGSASSALTNLETTANNLLLQFQSDLNKHISQGTEAHQFVVTSAK